MASYHPFAPRGIWRIQYVLRLPGKTVRRAKYAPTRADAQVLAHQIERLEAATRNRLAKLEEIEEWIERGWMKPQEAAACFPGFAEAARRAGRIRGLAVDFREILRRYEDYALRHSKAGSPFRKSHQNHMNLARQVVAWLEAEHPALELQVQGVEDWLEDLRQRYSSWSVYHYLTKLRLLLDQAQALGMIQENPARQVSVPMPKVTQERRILSSQEVQQLLEYSVGCRKWICGSLPTAVRLGLYAGLRDEEMCWLKWGAIDWHHRILNIQETVCEETGETWKPKDAERRRLDVKPALIEFLEGERRWQEEQKLLGPFVMPGGGWRLPDRWRRPLTQDALSHAFAKMIKEAGLDAAITVYSLRHTYCTSLLRPPPRGAGLDIRTVQQRMGHAELGTTMAYLHHIEPEEHPTDGLPY